MLSRDSFLHQHGWFFEAVDQHQNGYRVCGRSDEPSIRWSALASGSVQVTSIPGQITLVPMRAFDAQVAEELVAEWWSSVLTGS